eukprot:scaffold2249_cov86-Cylindrotheca_fusiformis.AAC.6
MPTKKEDETSKSSSTPTSGAADEAFRASSEHPAHGRRVELSTDSSKKSEENESNPLAETSQGNPSNGNKNTTEHDSAMPGARPIEGIGGLTGITTVSALGAPSDAGTRRSADVENQHPVYPQSLISAEVALDFEAAVNQAVEAALRLRDENIVEAQVVVSGGELEEEEEVPPHRNESDGILKNSDSATAKKKKRRMLIFGVIGLCLALLAIVLGTTLGGGRGDDSAITPLFDPNRPTETPIVDPEENESPTEPNPSPTQSPTVRTTPPPTSPPTESPLVQTTPPPTSPPTESPLVQTTPPPTSPPRRSPTVRPTTEDEGFMNGEPATVRPTTEDEGIINGEPDFGE